MSGKPRIGGLDMLDSTVTPELLAKALETVSQGALITDADHNTIYANSAFTAITGYPSDEIIGLNCRFLQGPDTSPQTVAEIRQALREGSGFQGEILNYRSDGSSFWNQLTITPMVNERGEITHFVSAQRDITAIVEERDQLSYEATHDPLTRLPNRAGLRRHVARELADAQLEGTAVGIVIMDLDSFKHINDVHGHQAGDEVLVEVARRVTASLRRGDYVARMGGDEFVVVISNLNRRSAIDQIASVMTRVHSVVELPFSVAGHDLEIGASAGVAIYPDHAVTPAELYRLADTALYSAKAREDRDSWWELAIELSDHAGGAGAAGADDEMGEERMPTPGVLELGTLELVYHPIVDLRGGGVHSVEALARLRTPEGRLIAPGQFLPFCTRDDLVRLFLDGLDQSMRWLATWEASGLSISVSLNIPPELLSDPASVAWVSESLAKHNVPAHRLSLELLESGDLDLEQGERTVAALIELGVHIHLDDVSSGYSTLKRMTELPFTVIKIDRRIFEASEVRPVQVITLISAIARLGEEFGYGVVIEGIEDREKFEVSVALQIGLGQGYLFTKPLDGARVADWVRSFSLPDNPELMTTPLGALAFHWAIGNQEGRVVPDIDACPVTAFAESRGDELRLLHEQFHEMGGGRNPAGAAFDEAMVALVTAEPRA